MLVEINCEYFNEKTITFHKGLNVVVGDNEASNSIGKSTLLSIIDFIFGGKTYIEKNTGSINTYGLHSFSFKFLFDKEYFFKIDTNRNKIYKCDSKYEILDGEYFEIEEYLLFLKEKYKFTEIELSFRNIISTFIRFWGKENVFVDKPLKLHKDSSDKDSIENLIKLFKLYEIIKKLNEDLKNKKENKSIYIKANKFNLINKITQSTYKKNLIELNFIDNKLKEIKKNLISYTKDVTKIVNEEILSLNSEKDKILSTLNYYKNKLERLKLNLDNKTYIKSKNLVKLKEFLPSINLDKIEEIEEFHNGISKILKKELKKDIDSTENIINELNLEYQDILKEIEKYYTLNDSSEVIFDSVYTLSLNKNKLETENEVYLKNQELIDNIKELSKLLDEKLKDIYENLNIKINNEIIKINKKVYKTNTSPEFKITENGNYIFSSENDKGTGKYYSNLLIFDIALNRLLNIPILIHDSFLYKNIQNETIEKFIELYNQLNTQSFISLDEISKYSKNTQKIILDKKIIKLSKTNILFTENWKN